MKKRLKSKEELGPIPATVPGLGTPENFEPVLKLRPQAIRINQQGIPLSNRILGFIKDQKPFSFSLMGMKVSVSFDMDFKDDTTMGRAWTFLGNKENPQRSASIFLRKGMRLKRLSSAQALSVFCHEVSHLVTDMFYRNMLGDDKEQDFHHEMIATVTEEVVKFMFMPDSMANIKEEKDEKEKDEDEDEDA